MAININYSSKYSYIFSFINVVLTSVWLFYSEDIEVLLPNYFIDLNFGVYKIPTIIRVIFSSVICLAMYNLSYYILRENKLFEGDKSVLLIPLNLGLTAFPSLLFQLEWIIISALFLITLLLLSSIHNQLKVNKETFLLGIIQAVLILFEPILALLIIPSLIGLALLRSFQLRESLFYILSISLLFFWLFSLLFLLDISYTVSIDYSFKLDLIQNKFNIYALVGLNAFFIVRAFLNSSKMVIRKKNQVKLFLGFLFTSILLLVFIDFHAVFAIILFPLVFLFAIYFQTQTRQGLVAILLFFLSIVFIANNLI